MESIDSTINTINTINGNEKRKGIEGLDFSNPIVLSKALADHGIWNDKWHDALVQKLCQDVKAGERTFEIDQATGILASRLKVVSGGLNYVTADGSKGIIRAEKEVTYFDKDGNLQAEKTQQFTEKDDRIVGGKMRVGDSAENTFLREAEEELPDELHALFNAHQIDIGAPNSTESVSPGFPNLKTIYEVHPAQTLINLPADFDLKRTFEKTEEKKFPNGEKKVTKIVYEFVVNN